MSKHNQRDEPQLCRVRGDARARYARPAAQPYLHHAQVAPNCGQVDTPRRWVFARAAILPKGPENEPHPTLKQLDLQGYKRFYGGYW